MNPPSADLMPRPLLHRGLIVLGWFCLARAILDLAATLLEFEANSFSARMLSFRSSGREWSYAAILGLRVLTAGLLGAAAVGLVRVQSWSRTMLQIWAVVLAVLAVCQSTFFASVQLESMRQVRSRGSTVSQTDAEVMAMHTLSALNSLILPALALWFITRPEVRNLWSGRKRGGFEVLPIPADR